MAVTTLDTSGVTAAAAINGFQATWDYDSTSQTVGVTASGGGDELSMTFAATGLGPVTVVLKNPGTNLMDDTRKVIFGPGSIAGHTAKVRSVPAGAVVTFAWAGP